ncbi:hypothetical protein P154DRAFT_539058 [Amniculicola lignicola CBS 123094]|uniref:Uncharacterized protein n=1 Tax=Amniculicola lignicola CBS 123094 TaxID=1392246 RepID=A0A6A5W7G1_9PLEO|nr:hypothetical protein P154DRAFT_539058 [Amniculicola lignicola CBS 123094]
MSATPNILKFLEAFKRLLEHLRPQVEESAWLIIIGELELILNALRSAGMEGDALVQQIEEHADSIICNLDKKQNDFSLLEPGSSSAAGLTYTPTLWLRPSSRRYLISGDTDMGDAEGQDHVGSETEVRGGVRDEDDMFQTDISARSRELGHADGLVFKTRPDLSNIAFNPAEKKMSFGQLVLLDGPGGQELKFKNGGAVISAGSIDNAIIEEAFVVIRALWRLKNAPSKPLPSTKGLCLSCILDRESTEFLNDGERKLYACTRCVARGMICMEETPHGYTVKAYLRRRSTNDPPTFWKGNKRLEWDGDLRLSSKSAIQSGRQSKRKISALPDQYDDDVEEDDSVNFQPVNKITAQSSKKRSRKNPKAGLNPKSGSAIPPIVITNQSRLRDRDDVQAEPEHGVRDVTSGRHSKRQSISKASSEPSNPAKRAQRSDFKHLNMPNHFIYSEHGAICLPDSQELQFSSGDQIMDCAKFDRDLVGEAYRAIRVFCKRVGVEYRPEATNKCLARTWERAPELYSSDDPDWKYACITCMKRGHVCLMEIKGGYVARAYKRKNRRERLRWWGNKVRKFRDET